jgi:Uma2 family endonuclease
VADYERAAQRYERRLPLEHFMEAIPQATQRRITLASLALVEAQLPDFQVFNELLVQYFHQGRLRQVVPDNAARRLRQPLVSPTSYICEEEPVGLFWTLEYVSPASYRKDYRDSFHKYEQELRVPYYLLFYPERQDLRLYHHTGTSYELVAANAHGRLAIAELELELALHESWLRFWFRGELLPLPGDLLQQVRQEKQRAEQAEQRAEQEKQRAEQEKQRAEQEKQRAEQEKQRAEQEKQRAEQAEAELVRLRQLLAQAQSGDPQRPLP